MPQHDKITPLIELPDESDLGDAMLACSLGERAYAICRVLEGLNATQAAIRAGYSSRGRNASTNGWLLEHRPRVILAMQELGRNFYKIEAVASLRVVRAIRDCEAVKPETRLKAAIAIMDRGGQNAVTEMNMVVEHRLTTEQKDARILQLAAELGLPKEAAQKLLIDPNNIIDAQFEVIEPAPLSDNPKYVALREARARRKNMTPEEKQADIARVRAEHAQKLKEKRALHEAARAAQMNVEDYKAQTQSSEDITQVPSEDGRDGLEDLLE